MRSKSKPVVKVLNPQGSGTHISFACARRYVEAGQAKFDSCGRLEFLRVDPQTVRRRLRGGALDLVKVTMFSGLDAFPDAPVLPSWPTVADLSKRARQHSSQF